jgi:hypothetical protein
MTAMKPARLTGTLLTRKGSAAPSVAPSSHDNPVETMRPRTAQSSEATRPADPKAAAPRKKLSDWIGPPKQKRAGAEPGPGEQRPAGPRIRVSLRLDMERHLRLKLVATHLNCTLQSLFTQAIDEYFERHTPDVLEAAALLRMDERAATNGNENGGASSSDRGTENTNGRLRTR